MRYTFLILFSLSLSSLWGQPQLFSVAKFEQKVFDLYDDITTRDYPDDKKKELNDKMIALFAEELQNPESFTNPYDSLKFIGKVVSDDGRVRIYTWNYPLTHKTHNYGGFIQYKLKNKKIRTIPLTIKNEAYLPLNNKRIPSNDWYGALYYRIIPVKYKKENYYVLLGWAGNDAASQYKVIEILNFDEKGNATFGKLALKQKNRTYQRFVMEYSAEAKASLTYDDRKKRIIFDHLVPPEPVFTNVFSYYGPDFTYDAFVLKEGKWEFEGNVDVRNRE